MSTDLCPVYAPFFGAMGCTAAIVFSCFGAAYGTAKSGKPTAQFMWKTELTVHQVWESVLWAC